LKGFPLVSVLLTLACTHASIERVGATLEDVFVASTSGNRPGGAT